MNDSQAGVMKRECMRMTSRVRWPSPCWRCSQCDAVERAQRVLVFGVGFFRSPIQQVRERLLEFACDADI